MAFPPINVFYIYFPVLVLLVLAFFRDRFEPDNESLRRQSWSYMFGLAIVSLHIIGHILLSAWHWEPELGNYKYNQFDLNISAIVPMIFTLGCVYASLRFIYKVSIIEIFNLKRNYLPFILKLGAVYTLIIVLGYYFVGLDLSDQQELKALKSMDTKNIIADLLSGLIVGPILEEIIYRGILYVPLYRKVGKHLAMILTSFAWTFGHFYDFTTSIGVFILGLFLAWLYNRSGSLLHPIIFHMFRNNWLIYYILPV